MKKTIWFTLSGLIVPVMLLTAFVGCNGCKSGQGQYNPSTGIYDTNALADVVVVTSQNLRESALGIFDAFMRVEKQNDAVLRALNPKIHEAAEEIRKNGKRYLDELTATTTTYQSARTPENASKLNSALAAVRSALVSASSHLAEASTGKATP